MRIPVYPKSRDIWKGIMYYSVFDLHNIRRPILHFSKMIGHTEDLESTEVK
jgi:hypothetical protein